MSPDEVRASAEAIEDLLENYVVAAFFGDQQEKEESMERLDGNIEGLWRHLESLI